MVLVSGVVTTHGGSVFLQPATSNNILVHGVSGHIGMSLQPSKSNTMLLLKISDGFGSAMLNTYGSTVFAAGEKQYHVVT